MVGLKKQVGIILFLWWFCASCAAAGEISQHQAGFYIIAAEAPSAAALPTPKADQQVVRYDQKFLRDPDAEPRYLLMPKRPDVTLKLAKPPELGKSANGFAELQLELTAEAAVNLEKVSHENLGKTVAFVVDGEPVTIHKIRSVITGGQFKLSRCTDNACQFIYGRLTSKP
jgi:preprotein translocase subunit SecD